MILFIVIYICIGVAFVAYLVTEGDFDNMLGVSPIIGAILGWPLFIVGVIYGVIKRFIERK